MDPKSTKSSRRRRSGRCTNVLLQVLRLSFLGAAPVPAFGYFLGDTKAVLNGCKDHWTLQDSTFTPFLSQMTVCLDVRVLSPGAWVAFSYSSVHAPMPDLGLEGNEGAVYGWLLGVRHRFPVSLSLARWHTVCLRRDVPGKSFSLELNGRLVAKRTVIAQAIPPSGSLWLGCRPRQRPRGAVLGQVEVYMFRMWDDLAHRGPCEDGTVIGWDARFWGLTSPRARQTDRQLHCVSAFTDSPRQSQPASVIVTPRDRMEKSSKSESTTSSDINGSSAVTASEFTSNDEIASRPLNLAPPADHILAGRLSSSSRTPHERSQKSARKIADSSLPRGSAIAPLINDTSRYDVTTTPSTSDYDATTRYKGFTRLPNDTVYNKTTPTFLPSASNTLDDNVTAVSEITPLIKDTPRFHHTTPSTTSDATTRKTFPHLPNDKTGSNFLLPSAHKTLEYNVTAVGAITPFINDTSQHNLTTRVSTSGYRVTTHHKTTETEYNVTSDLLLPLADTPLESNEPPVGTTAALLKDTSRHNLTAPSSTSPSNVTALKASSPVPNDATLQNKATGRLLPSANSTLENNATGVGAMTPFVKDTPPDNLTAASSTSLANATPHKAFPNDPEVYDVTAADASTPTDIADLNGTTASAITPLIKDTPRYNLTAAFSSLVDDVTAHKAFPNDTAADDITATDATPTDRTDLSVTQISAWVSLIKDAPQDHRMTSSPQPVDDVTTRDKALTSGANRAAGNTANVLADRHDSTPASRPTYAPTTPGDAQPDDVTDNRDAAFSHGYAKHNVQTATQNSTDGVIDDTPLKATVPDMNKHPASYCPTTSDDITPSTTNAAAEAIDDITTNKHEDAFAVSTNDRPEARVESSTKVGASRERFARTSATMTATTTETLQSKNAATESSSPGSGTPSMLSSGTKNNLEEQAEKLLEKTRDASQLNSSQVAELVAELERLLDAPVVSQALGKKAVSIVSNLMEGDPLALDASSNRIIAVVEDLGLKLLLTDAPVVLSSGSLVLAVQKVDGSDFPEMSVNIVNTEDVQISDGGERFKNRDSAMASVYLPSSIMEALSGDERKLVDRVQFTFYSQPILFQDDTLNNQTVVTSVLASSVSNVSISNLTDNIRFTIRNSQPIHASYEAVCAFWDFAMSGGAGGWSTTGCTVASATSWRTTCTCSHLTSFAVLLDLSRGGINDRKQAQILTFITYIGCGISAIFLAATLLTYLSFEKLLRDIPAKILVQLCFSLLLLNLVFLLDGWLAQSPARGLCISTAFFLHYFLLTSFTWAGLEALHMYLSIVRVFTPYLSRYMLKFSLIGWGVPVVVVVVVISVDKDNYGLVSYGRNMDGTSGDFCWVRSDAAFYAGVVAYFLLVFASCLLVFAVVMVQLSRIKKQNPHNQSPHRGVVADLRSVAGLVALLGLAWGFALFAWEPLYLPFAYLFTIFNSLQGLFVFIFHCACKESVRRQWQTFLCCGHLRLAEISEWGRAAARENRNFAVTTSGVSTRQLASRSSSLASNSTNSGSSVFADSGMSEGSSCDVVLNELHRQTVAF
ncbi:adhesion G-protein coupled receptor G4 isoform X2 [Hippocampus comes]|uniref:adhesion G-protein coupled receptor G4 isoform X2 n=1 Tax=Hippocampus comes TaxID=109280 RepID=UPI00094F2DCE|nr:PREDICTED: adhesion G-protein coupled receptor G2 isoform X2 [Hippocampus comes]